MVKYISQLLFVTLSCLTVGCSVFSPVKLRPQSTYLLDTTPNAISTTHKGVAVLLVADPESSATYNTSKMAYSVRPFQVAYFSENKWAEAPAAMLSPLMVETLQETKRYHAVITPGVSTRYDYVLHTQLTELQQDFTVTPAVVRLTVSAELMSVNTRRVLAAKQFAVIESMRYKTPDSGVYAANRAVVRFLQQLRTFCLTNSL